MQPGDEILVSHLEHHANIVPWQLLCEQTGARLRVIPMTRDGELDFDAYLGLLSGQTRLLALAHVSNALGTIVPVDRFIAEARRRGVTILLDGAQAVPHMKVDVQALDCDFYCFSAHKMCGPTGIGVLYGREALLDGDATLAGRRRHDPGGELRTHHLQRGPAQVRSRHAAHRRRGRTGGSGGLPGDARARTDCSRRA